MSNLDKLKTETDPKVHNGTKLLPIIYKEILVENIFCLIKLLLDSQIPKQVYYSSSFGMN